MTAKEIVAQPGAPLFAPARGFPRVAVPTGAAPIAALVLASLSGGPPTSPASSPSAAIPPATLAALRFAVALAILWPLARWHGGPRVPARVTAPLGVLGVALTFLLQNLGLARTTATNASLLQGAAPVLTRCSPRSSWASVSAPAASRPCVGDGRRGGGDAGGRRRLRRAGLGRRSWWWPAPAASPPSSVLGAAPFRSMARSRCWPAWPPGGRRRCYRSRCSRRGSRGLPRSGGACCVRALPGGRLLGVDLRPLGLCASPPGGRARGPSSTLIPLVGLAAAVLVLGEAPLIGHFSGGRWCLAGVGLAVREPRADATAAPANS